MVRRWDRHERRLSSWHWLSFCFSRCFLQRSAVKVFSFVNRSCCDKVTFTLPTDLLVLLVSFNEGRYMKHALLILVEVNRRLSWAISFDSLALEREIPPMVNISSWNNLVLYYTFCSILNLFTVRRNIWKFSIYYWATSQHYQAAACCYRESMWSVSQSVCLSVMIVSPNRLRCSLGCGHWWDQGGTNIGIPMHAVNEQFHWPAIEAVQCHIKFSLWNPLVWCGLLSKFCDRLLLLVTGQLADTPTRGLDNSRSRRCRQKRKLSTQSRRWHPRVVQSTTCPVRELSSPRVDQSARCPVRESSSPRVGNPRVGVSASCPVTLLLCQHRMDIQTQMLQAVFSMPV